MRMTVNVNFNNDKEVEEAYIEYVSAKMKLERCLNSERLEASEETASEGTDTAL